MHPLLFQCGHLVDDLAESTWAGSVSTHIISEKLMYTWFFQPIDLVPDFTELTRLNFKTCGFPTLLLFIVLSLAIGDRV